MDHGVQFNSRQLLHCLLSEEEKKKKGRNLLSVPSVLAHYAMLDFHRPLLLLGNGLAIVPRLDVEAQTSYWPTMSDASDDNNNNNNIIR